MYQNSESKRTFWKDVYLECYIKVEEYLSSEDIWGKRYEVVAENVVRNQRNARKSMDSDNSGRQTCLNSNAALFSVSAKIPRWQISETHVFLISCFEKKIRGEDSVL